MWNTIFNFLWNWWNQQQTEQQKPPPPPPPTSRAIVLSTGPDLQMVANEENGKNKISLGRGRRPSWRWNTDEFLFGLDNSIMKRRWTSFEVQVVRTGLPGEVTRVMESNNVLLYELNGTSIWLDGNPSRKLVDGSAMWLSDDGTWFTYTKEGTYRTIWEYSLLTNLSKQRTFPELDPVHTSANASSIIPIGPLIDSILVYEGLKSNDTNPGQIVLGARHEIGLIPADGSPPYVLIPCTPATVGFPANFPDYPAFLSIDDPQPIVNNGVLEIMANTGRPPKNGVNLGGTYIFSADGKQVLRKVENAGILGPRAWKMIHAT